MRLKSATLHGLWGVYSASGKKEIYIDFTKCMHNIVLIIGKNGSGKTTIWEALQPIPLPASKFIDREPGFIHLEYFYEDLIYKIRIEYPITNSRDRAQTKAFITKITENDQIELNPNGNINSYKSILYSEFNLDPSFVSLSQISQEDMGIVNKKPSERKKYVSSITDNIEVYNGIYKSLVKRSSIFKSMINSITAKMDTIGNQENLMTNLTAKEVIIDRLVTERDFLIRRKIESERDIATADPDKKIQDEFKQLTAEITEHKKQLLNYTVFVQSIVHKYLSSDVDDLRKKNSDTEKTISDYIAEAKVLEATISHLSNEKNKLQIEFNNKSEKIRAIQSEYNYNKLRTEIADVKSKIYQCKQAMEKLGFINDSDIISRDIFVAGIHILSMIKDKINEVKSTASSEQALQTALNTCKGTATTASELDDKNNDLETTIHLLELSEKNISEYHYYQKISEKLMHRPDECNVVECFFIKDAVEAASKCSDMDIHSLETEHNRLLEEKDNLIKDIEFLSEQLHLELAIKDIFRFIETNKPILEKFPTCKSLLNFSMFLTEFCNSLFIDNISTITNSMNCANIFEDYKALNARLDDLTRDEKIYKDKEDTMKTLEEELKDIETTINDHSKRIAEKIEKSKSINDSIQSLTSCRDDILDSIDIVLKYKEEEKRVNDLETRVQELANNISSIEKYIQSINEIDTRLSAIDSDLKPINAEKDQLKFSLKQLEEYKAELAMYVEKYNTVEIIKKYSSPTKGGIQTLFMQLYMGKTISMTNELLTTLFDGRMELEPYIINDSEFRIPCINKESNVYHDDISSCSSAERAMISMMIGFSLLYHSSTMYNILRMDEIDGALDQDNRSSFISLLNSFMGKFGIEQCIMISHSSEINMGEVDVIQLVPVAGTQNSGNIIFTYE